MKTLIIILFILTISGSIWAQDSNTTAHTIKGKVVHATSNKPVSFTNIGLEGTYHGTASDEDGNFELKIPQEMTDKNIYFSAVGFKKNQFPVKDLFGKEFNVVKLKSQTYGVNEVDIAAQNKVLIRILRLASENIKYNYGAGPFNMHCNYTNQTTSETEEQAQQKAAVLIYDEKGYSEPSQSDEYISRNYAVEKEKGAEDYSFANGILNIDDLLALDWVRSTSCVLNPALLNDYSLKLESQPTIEGKEYWVIAFSQNSPTLESTGDYYATSLEGTITVNKVDYSVLRIEGKVESEKNNRQGAGLAIGSSNKNYFSDVSYDFSVSYKDLVLKTVELNKKYTYKGKNTEQKSVLQVKHAHTNNLIEIETRQYFAGE